jgi:diguanylate cyclase
VNWHFEAELASAVFLITIWIYSHEKNMVLTLKNRIFKGCIAMGFLSVVINLFSMMLILNKPQAGTFILLSVRSLHFILVSLNTALIEFYILAFVCEETGENPRKPLMWSLTPYAAFFFLVISNPMTGVLFTVDSAGNFTNGPLFLLVYGIHYFYCVVIFITIFKWKKSIPPDTKRVLLAFPALSLLFTVVQQMLPRVLLSGTASASILLIAYLYLQNKRIYEDRLTGLPNREAYIKTLQVLMDKKSKIIVMSISLNDFKFINDKFGQVNGDVLLKTIANFLGETVSLTSVYRYGGDKFAIIFDKQRLETAGDDICKIADRFNLPWKIQNCTCHLGAGIGVAYCPETANNMQELVSMLESAVEKAKKSGITQPVFCDRETIGLVRRKHFIKDILSDALENDTFGIYYQPLYSIKHNRFFEAEALLRLADENGKFLSPEEFIPIAEETGLIVDIGYMVVDKVCKYIRTLLQSGIEISTISINLSVVQLMKSDIVPRLLQIIHGNGISPSRIVFEITESILVSNYGMVAEKIKELSESGIRFALDDFGTGYSNLSHVIDLPFHMIKFDKSLIWDSMTNQKCYILICDLTKTFKNMNFLVIAEGVETLEHDTFVQLCGCDRIQGYRYARPMTASKANGYLGRSLSEIQE